jgi:hypothetical protein
MLQVHLHLDIHIDAAVGNRRRPSAPTTDHARNPKADGADPSFDA